MRSHPTKKNFCTVKGVIIKTKSQPTEREKVFMIDISDNGLIYKKTPKYIK